MTLPVSPETALSLTNGAGMPAVNTDNNSSGWTKRPMKLNLLRVAQAQMARSIAFREALREAMNEEMRRDDRVFLMGEEVAEYNGAYKVSQGMLAEFGPKRVIDTPISELGFTGIGCWCCTKWPSAHR